MDTLLTVKKLLDISLNPPSNICLFGAGDIGKSFAYDFITTAGIKIDFYCDNNIPEGTEIRDGVKVESIDRIISAKGDIIVFISVSKRYQGEIYKQLCSITDAEIYDIENYYFFPRAMDEIESLGRGVQRIFWNYYDDETYLYRRYRERTGKTLDLIKPKSFNEKLQWLKLNDRNPLYTKLADKVEVKRYVCEQLGSGHTIPTIAIYEEPEDIDIDELPEKFVLKCTHDGGIIVCDKSEKDFNIKSVRKELQGRMERNYYWYDRGWEYKNIKPRIICEPFVTDETKTELRDYKVFCFSGQPELIEVDYNRFNNHKRNLYTTNWEFVDSEILFPSDKNHIIERPQKLSEMLEYASILSKGIPHVRVDFYLCGNDVLIGEMTFRHGSGCEQFRPNSFGDWLGDFIDISMV